MKINSTWKTIIRFCKIKKNIINCSRSNCKVCESISDQFVDKRISLKEKVCKTLSSPSWYPVFPFKSLYEISLSIEKPIGSVPVLLFFVVKTNCTCGIP